MDRPGPGVYGARRRGASTPVTRLAEANRLDVAQDELAILGAPAEVRDDAVARPLRLFTEISPSRRAADGFKKLKIYDQFGFCKSRYNPLSYLRSPRCGRECGR